MRKVAVVCLLALMAGCASTFVETRVSAFHELDQPLAGATYAIVPSKAQESSLEFRSYAALVKAELTKRGLREAPFDQAKYAIFMFYGIDDGKQVVSSYPIFGQTGTSGSYTSGSVSVYGNTATYSGTTRSTPTVGVVGTGTRSDTEYTRYLNIDILDIAKSGNGKLSKVYEGKATSQGSSDQISEIMPPMVKSVFADFPGKSGMSRTIRQSLN